MKFLESLEPADHGQKETESVAGFGMNLLDFGQFAKETVAAEGSGDFSFERVEFVDGEVGLGLGSCKSR